MFNTEERSTVVDHRKHTSRYQLRLQCVKTSAVNNDYFTHRLIAQHSSPSPLSRKPPPPTFPIVNIAKRRHLQDAGRGSAILYCVTPAVNLSGDPPPPTTQLPVDCKDRRRLRTIIIACINRTLERPCKEGHVLQETQLRSMREAARRKRSLADDNIAEYVTYKHYISKYLNHLHRIPASSVRSIGSFFYNEGGGGNIIKLTSSASTISLPSPFHHRNFHHQIIPSHHSLYTVTERLPLLRPTIPAPGPTAVVNRHVIPLFGVDNKHRPDHLGPRCLQRGSQLARNGFNCPESSWKTD
ncbi:hypothetical protein J6590_081022 [Homalodisca vitripennis]|nr:hypothetical protein J6590_081022 [Homalodisca vitripennis]